MKTTRYICRKILLAAVATFLGVTCTKVHSQTVYSVNIVGCVPDMTIELLTAPLTLAERQALHAQNFNNLPLAAHPVYLHCVAYAVGCTVASNGQVPDAAILREHLTSISSIDDVPAVQPEDSQRLQAHLSFIHTKMKELNLFISTQVANNPGYQQAMYAGAVDGFFDTEMLW